MAHSLEPLLLFCAFFPYSFLSRVLEREGEREREREKVVSAASSAYLRLLQLKIPNANVSLALFLPLLLISLTRTQSPPKKISSFGGEEEEKKKSLWGIGKEKKMLDKYLEFLTEKGEKNCRQFHPSIEVFLSKGKMFLCQR